MQFIPKIYQVYKQFHTTSGRNKIINIKLIAVNVWLGWN